MKNRNLMQNLIRFYAVILIVVITVFSIFVSTIIIRENVVWSKRATLDLSKQVSQTVMNYSSDTNRIYAALFDEPLHYNDLFDYMELSPADYYRKKIFDPIYTFYPRKVHDVYDEYPALSSVNVHVQGFDDVYVSNLKNKYGKKKNKANYPARSLSLSKNIIRNETFQQEGVLTLSYNDAEIVAKLETLPAHLDVEIYVANDLGQLIYSNTNANHSKIYDSIRQNLTVNIPIEENEDYSSYYIFKDVATKNIKVYTLASKKAILFQSIKMSFSIILFGIILDLILLKILYQTFGTYSYQVHDILNTLKNVEYGELNTRISERGKDSELLDITQAINDMLNSIERYIDEIYQLEIKQRDINMMALQSQINPHFLYNTLEFIRMYAVSEGVDELADIVYTFSTLLRNNISLEKTSTLEKELEFSEKYVYLYQMRYPGRIAYKFEIDDRLRKIMIPKFTLQPLIENFLIHGVDFKRVDNAINVNAFISGEEIVIQVSDNGKGVTKNKMHALQYKIDHSKFDDINESSVGMINVHERLKSYFGQGYYMKLSDNFGQGFRVEIIFRKDDVRV
ncbi:MAG TPA: sensor histidine kinase [Erysipelothrix sp.]